VLKSSQYMSESLRVQALAKARDIDRRELEWSCGIEEMCSGSLPPIIAMMQATNAGE
jgi:hypothetical protein